MDQEGKIVVLITFIAKLLEIFSYKEHQKT